MPTPPKSYAVIKTEGKSHRTKAELKARESAEKALITGTKLKERPEVSANKVAHKEFLRVSKLLEKIEKNDAIYEAVINRYCMLQAECKEFESKRESFQVDIDELTRDKEQLLENGMALSTYFKLKKDMQASIIALDKQIETKRKMILAIEKENLMTIAAALKSIPKKTEEPHNQILEVLQGGNRKQSV